jgi:streptogramin lyase
VSVVPSPAGDFDEQPSRFGPHNLHENRAGSYRSDALVFVTYFNAGLRVYDLTDPVRPEEVASWVPDQEAPQSNDLYVEESGRVWVTDRFTGGLSCLEPEPELAALIRARRAAAST